MVTQRDEVLPVRIRLHGARLCRHRLSFHRRIHCHRHVIYGWINILRLLTMSTQADLLIIDNVYLLLTSLRGRRCSETPSSWSVRGAVVRQESGSAAGMMPAEKNSCCSSLSTEGRRAGFDCSCSTIIDVAGFRSDDGILYPSCMIYILGTSESFILGINCACFYFVSENLTVIVCYFYMIIFVFS